jgi:hypothetical protein
MFPGKNKRKGIADILDLKSMVQIRHIVLSLSGATFPEAFHQQDGL